MFWSLYSIQVSQTLSTQTQQVFMDGILRVRPFHMQTGQLKMACVHAQSLHLCLTLCDPMDCSPPVSSVHGIFQARILEWVAISSSRISSQPRDTTHVSCISCIAGRFFTAEPLGKPKPTYRFNSSPIKIMAGMLQKFTS